MTTTTEQLNGLFLTRDEQRAVESQDCFARLYPVRADADRGNARIHIEDFPHEALSVVPAGFSSSALCGGQYASNVPAETLVLMGLVCPILLRHGRVTRAEIEDHWRGVWRRWYSDKDIDTTVVVAGFFEQTESTRPHDFALWGAEQGLYQRWVLWKLSTKGVE